MMSRVRQVQSQLTPDEHIVRLAVEHLAAWLDETGPDRLRQMIAGDEDPGALLPDPLPLDDLSWAKRGILRARICVPRPDLYAEILRRLERSHPREVELLRRLDGASRWYKRTMERVRGRVLAALAGAGGRPT
jgi:hypothetical protein